MVFLYIAHMHQLKQVFEDMKIRVVSFYLDFPSNWNSSGVVFHSLIYQKREDRSLVVMITKLDCFTITNFCEPLRGHNQLKLVVFLIFFLLGI